MNKLILKWIFLLLFINCYIFKENKPIQKPGIGVQKNKNQYFISFDVGIFTFEDQQIQRNEVEELFKNVITELEIYINDIKLNPVFDQPHDAPFIMSRVVSKRLNPFIENYQQNNKFNYINNFIIEISNQDFSGKYFLSSQLHHFLYSQVRYDILLIPFPILSDFNYDNPKQGLEIKNSEVGIAKGRTALDKLGIITYIDYKNINSKSNQEIIKITLLSFILTLPLEVSFEFVKENYFECKKYLEKRKKIFDIYYHFHNGKLKEACRELYLHWIEWSTQPYLKKHSSKILDQIEENFKILEKRCKKV